METTTTERVTFHTAVQLSRLMVGVQAGARCAMEVSERGELLEGTLRAFTPRLGGGAFCASNDDLLSAFVHITAGFEHFVPVMDVLEKMDEGTFGIF